MSNRNNTLVLSLAGCLVLTMAWFGGFFYHAYTGTVSHSRVDTLLSITTTTKIYDSTQHNIPVIIETPEHIIERPIPANIDTQKVLQAYFGSAYYSRHFSDSNISATMDDTVTENRLGTGKFTYKLIRPHTTIHSTTTTLQPVAPGSTQFFVGFNSLLAGAQVHPMPQVSVLNTSNGNMLSLFTNLAYKQPNAGIGFQKRIFKIKHKHGKH